MRTDRPIIVTGAGGGMGSKSVRRFESGDTVTACDSDGPALDRLMGELGKSDRLHTGVFDISVVAG